MISLHVPSPSRERSIAELRSDSPVSLRGPNRCEIARERFLDALEPQCRDAVALVLRDPRRGGTGLRDWIRQLSTGSAEFPVLIPTAVIDVYLSDPEAVPHHDCENCGLAVPVRHRYGLDHEQVEHVYFPTCPSCGGKTGRYARLGRQVLRER